MCNSEFFTISVSFHAFHIEASLQCCEGGIWKLKSKDLLKRFINLPWYWSKTQIAFPWWHSIYWHFTNAWKLVFLSANTTAQQFCNTHEYKYRLFTLYVMVDKNKDNLIKHISSHCKENWICKFLHLMIFNRICTYWTISFLLKMFRRVIWCEQGGCSVFKKD